MSEEKVIVIERSDTEELRIAPREYKGRHYVDIRVFYLPEDNPEMIPTRKGVTIYKKELRRVHNAIQSILASE